MSILRFITNHILRFANGKELLEDRFIEKKQSKKGGHVQVIQTTLSFLEAILRKWNWIKLNNLKISHASEISVRKTFGTDLSTSAKQGWNHRNRIISWEKRREGTENVTNLLIGITNTVREIGDGSCLLEAKQSPTKMKKLIKARHTLFIWMKVRTI